MGIFVLWQEQGTGVSQKYMLELRTCVRSTWFYLWSSYITVEISEASVCNGFISLIIIIMYFLHSVEGENISHLDP